MKQRNQNGFTLYELLTTVAVVGVVLMIGVPNLGAYRQNARMTTTANDLHSAFHLARTEATRAKQIVTVCPSATSMDANPVCGGTWDQGYIVFIDNDGNLQVGVGDTILRAQPAIAEGVTLAVANDATYFSFAATGRGRGNLPGLNSLTQVVMCDDRGNIVAAGGNSASRLFVATPLGRATIQREISMITDALDDMGKSCP